MTRTIAVLAFIGLAATALIGNAEASGFKGQGLTRSNNNTVTMPPRTCVPHGHFQCPNPPGSTLPDCRGGHMGPNGVMINCK